MTSRQNSTVITDELSLHDAAASGDEKKLEELKIFIKRGKFEIDFKDEDWGERTALHCASERGHLRCCKSLIEGGADPSSRMCMGWTPVHCAAEGGHLAVLQLLAESGASVTARDDYGDTAKLIARRYAHEECVTYLESVENCPEQRRKILKDNFQYAVRKNMNEISDGTAVDTLHPS